MWAPATQDTFVNHQQGICWLKMGCRLSTWATGEAMGQNSGAPFAQWNLKNEVMSREWLWQCLGCHQ